jgi:hypothetical protein
MLSSISTAHLLTYDTSYVAPSSPLYTRSHRPAEDLPTAFYTQTLSPRLNPDLVQLTQALAPETRSVSDPHGAHSMQCLA